ncbi:hypothetical protein BH09PLA1_BH09PLA1_22780 [soil metagenome]
MRTQRADFTNPLIFWHRLTLGIKSVLPKTSETVALLSRSLEKYANIHHQEADESTDDSVMPNSNSGDSGKGSRRRNHDREEVLMDRARVSTITDFNRRSLFWVIGTSLIFEGVMLSIAAIVFCRRDF